MPPQPDHTITDLVQEIRDGAPGASDRLLALVYEDLRRLARSQRDALSVDPTSLVHRAWQRLGGGADGFENRRHFFFAAGRAMRRILVEHARRHRDRRRRTVPLTGGWEAPGRIPVAPETDHVALDELVEGLEPDHRRLVELRFYAGLSMPETAEAMNLPLRTLEREWRYVKARLHRDLSDREDAPGGRRSDG